MFLIFNFITIINWTLYIVIQRAIPSMPFHHHSPLLYFSSLPFIYLSSSFLHLSVISSRMGGKQGHLKKKTWMWLPLKELPARTFSRRFCPQRQTFCAPKSMILKEQNLVPQYWNCLTQLLSGWCGVSFNVFTMITKM